METRIVMYERHISSSCREMLHEIDTELEAHDLIRGMVSFLDEEKKVAVQVYGNPVSIEVYGKNHERETVREVGFTMVH